MSSLRIDRDSGLVYANDCRVELARQEFRLLLALASDPLRLHSRAELYVAAWGGPLNGQVTRTVDAHFHRLRRKLGGLGPGWFQTVRGQGWRLVAGPDVHGDVRVDGAGPAGAGDLDGWRGDAVALAARLERTAHELRELARA